MKIGIFTDTFAPEINGVATSCESLFNVLKKQGHDVYLFTTGKKTFYDANTHIYRIHGLFLKQLYGYRLVSPLRCKIYKFIKNLHLDVIHINTEYGVGLIGIHSAKKFKIPIAYTYHTNLDDYTYYVTKGILDKQAKKLLSKILKKYCSDVDELIVPSVSTKERLQKIGVKKYFNVVPTGFDFSRFDNIIEPEKFAEIKKTLQISDENKILLCLGRLAKEKSFDVIISNFKAFLDRTKKFNYKLLIVGDGPARKSLDKLVDKYHLTSNVIFVGKVPLERVQYYYQLADVYLNASTTETQGLTYMEAMASNLIVLSKKANYLNDIIIDGVSGFYFESNKDFFDKLNIIMNLSKEEADKIRKVAKDKISIYSSEKFYENIMKVYKRAIRDRW